VLIVRQLKGALADLAGIRPGNVVQQVAGRKVRKLSELLTTRRPLGSSWTR
jgi:C-terminal processing protease CtpA/Prc